MIFNGLVAASRALSEVHIPKLLLANCIIVSNGGGGFFLAYKPTNVDASSYLLLLPPRTLL